MRAQNKPDTKRGEIAFIFAIALGVLLGLLIKRIKIGIIIGIVLGLLVLFTGFLRSKRN